MSKYFTAVLFAVYSVIFLFLFIGDSHTYNSVVPYEPLEGMLLRGNIKAFDGGKIPFPVKPENYKSLKVYLEENQGNLKKENYLLEFVDLKDAEYKITSKSQEKEIPSHTKPKTIIKLVKKKKSITRKKTQSLPESGPKINQSISTELRKYDFKYFNEIIKKDSASYVLNSNYKKGNIEFKVDRISKWKDKYLLRFVVANSGDSEFFISSILLMNDDLPIDSKSFMPFSCRPNDTLSGILVFNIENILSNNVGITLNENGKPYRKFPIKKVGYYFQ